MYSNSTYITMCVGIRNGFSNSEANASEFLENRNKYFLVTDTVASSSWTNACLVLNSFCSIDALR